MTPPPTARSLVERVTDHADRLAVVDGEGPLTYREVDGGARALATELLGGRSSLTGERVALLCRPGRDAVIGLLATWWAGGLAVALNPSYPHAELAWLLDDAEASHLVASTTFDTLTSALADGRELRVTDVARRPPLGATTKAMGAPEALRPPHPDQPALMVHTSGTTGRPKGVVHTHASLAAQIQGMVEAWGWVPDDRILQVLPLHHVHGIVNVTLCPLWVGRRRGGAGRVRSGRRRGSASSSGRVSVFMAVPTIYARLISAWDAADAPTRARWSAGAAELRLMVSGSAALPVSVLDRWKDLTGHVLLERYGMTEVGMALGNTLDRRVPGHVGVPFPGVATRLVDDTGADVADGEAGELLLRGPQLFAGYWNRPDADAEAFTEGWFRTGDVAVSTPQGFRLLGRASVDILKTGGEKVSALEIEEVFRTHPEITDCAVVGLPDEEWGERVAMALVPALDASPASDALRGWGKEHLAPAKVPTRYLVVTELPRNAMGKVSKREVQALFAEDA